MSEIPKIIHQTWRVNTLPKSMLACCDSWRKYHPDWEYRFYNDQDCIEFVSQNYPDFAEVFNALPTAIQRVDFFRYLVVNRVGGLYADMDIFFHRNIDDLLKGRKCVFSIEAHLSRQRQKELGYSMPYQIGNCVFAACPEEGFLNRLIDRVIELSKTQITMDDHVEDTTGPRMLTRLYYELGTEDRKTVNVLPQINLLSPTLYPPIFPFNINMYARHLCMGTWKKDPKRFSLRRFWIERNRLPPFWRTSTISG